MRRCRNASGPQTTLFTDISGGSSLPTVTWFLQQTRSCHFPRPDPFLKSIGKMICENPYPHSEFSFQTPSGSNQWAFAHCLSTQTAQMIGLKYAHAYLVSYLLAEEIILFVLENIISLICLSNQCMSTLRVLLEVSTSEIMKEVCLVLLWWKCLKSWSYVLWRQRVPRCLTVSSHVLNSINFRS